jgi:hypothetical protein
MKSAHSSISRRQFLAASAEISLGIAALTGTSGLAASQRVLGANQRGRLAVCGIRKRGFDHVRLSESRQLIRAARRYDRIVEHGTQTRSSPSANEAIARLRQSLIGEVYLARGLCYERRNTIGHAPVEAVPAGVPYDLWTGVIGARLLSRSAFNVYS